MRCSAAPKQKGVHPVCFFCKQDKDALVFEKTLYAVVPGLPHRGGKIKFLNIKTSKDNNVIMLQNSLESRQLFCFRRYARLKKEKTNEKKDKCKESKAA